MTCAACQDRGLLRIAYATGEPFDVAICRCRVGQAYRTGGVACVRARLDLSAEHRIAYLEDFDDEPIGAAPSRSFLEAGRVGPRAKL